MTNSTRKDPYADLSEVYASEVNRAPETVTQPNPTPNLWRDDVPKFRKV